MRTADGRTWGEPEDERARQWDSLMEMAEIGPGVAGATTVGR